MFYERTSKLRRAEDRDKSGKCAESRSGCSRIHENQVTSANCRSIGRGTLRRHERSCRPGWRDAERQTRRDIWRKFVAKPRLACRSFQTCRLLSHLLAVSASSDVQCGQRLALMGIVIEHKGQSLETAGASGAGFFILLSARTIRKMQNATIKKLTTNVTKLP